MLSEKLKTRGASRGQERAPSNAYRVNCSLWLSHQDKKRQGAKGAGKRRMTKRRGLGGSYRVKCTAKSVSLLQQTRYFHLGNIEVYYIASYIAADPFFISSRGRRRRKVLEKPRMLSRTVSTEHARAEGYGLAEVENCYVCFITARVRHTPHVRGVNRWRLRPRFSDLR